MISLPSPRHFLLLALLVFAGPFLLPGVAGAVLPDPIQFSRIIELGDSRQAREWLDEGLSPDFEGQPIGTGLMIAAWTGNIAMMELFVSRGADVNKTNALGEQALLHAAWKGHGKAVDWLLAHGAKLSREGKQWAALHYAAFAGHADIVRLLLARGADVNALSTNGSTPLMMAAREGKEGIAAELLQAGASPEVRNDWGDTAEVWAVRQNNARIAHLVGTSDPALRKPIVSNVPAQRSLPVSDAADRLLSKARELEAQGRRADALKAFRTALASLRQQEQEQSRQKAKSAGKGEVAGIRITARRNDPESQSATLNYERPASIADTGARVSPGGTASGPSVKAAAWDPATEIGAAIAPSSSPQDPVDRLLTQARTMEAQGKRADAVRLYRQAAELLRRF